MMQFGILKTTFQIQQCAIRISADLTLNHILKNAVGLTK